MVSLEAHASSHDTVQRAPRPVGSVRIDPRWIGPDERPLLAWLSSCEGRVSDSGVLILSPVATPTGAPTARYAS